MFHVKQRPEASAAEDTAAAPGFEDVASSADPRFADGGAAALQVYREQLDRYRRTLDLMSDRGFDDLDAKMAEADRYAEAVRRHAVAGPVLDVGSGAGLPGVVVAARLAPRPVWWVERRRRRAAFLDQTAARAGLRSVRVAAADVRSLDAAQVGRVTAVTAQAVASLADVAALTRHLWADDVVLVSRKGPGWEGEVEALRESVRRWPGAGTAASVELVEAEPLGTRGTLVAVRVRGGSACPPSV